MQSTIGHIEDIISKAGDIIDTKTELVKLQTAGKISETVSTLISIIAIVAMAAVALIILSIGVAYWIGTSLGNLYYGFFAVGGFYALTGLVIYVFRKPLIKTPLSNLIIDKIAD